MAEHPMTDLSGVGAGSTAVQEKCRAGGLSTHWVTPSHSHPTEQEE